MRGAVCGECESAAAQGLRELDGAREREFQYARCGAREVIWCVASAEKLVAAGYIGRCGDFTPSTERALKTGQSFAALAC